MFEHKTKPVDAPYTLRDRFAVEAMREMVRQTDLHSYLNPLTVNDIGARSYMIADAMIEARDREDNMEGEDDA